jgi:hypothetical protein
MSLQSLKDIGNHMGIAQRASERFSTTPKEKWKNSRKSPKSATNPLSPSVSMNLQISS